MGPYCFVAIYVEHPVAAFLCKKLYSSQIFKSLLFLFFIGAMTKDSNDHEEVEFLLEAYVADLAEIGNYVVDSTY